MEKTCSFSFQLFSTGVITSPNHPDGYPSNLEKTQTIKVVQGLVLSLHFTVFALDLGDYLSITDGDGTTLMGSTSGYSKPANITSRTNVVKLLFTTNEAHPRTGWSVNWSAVSPGVLTSKLLKGRLRLTICRWACNTFSIQEEDNLIQA